MIIRRWLLALSLVFSGWVATLAAIMVLTDAAPGAIVLWPSEGFVDRLPPEMAIAGGGPGWIAIRGEATGFGRALYRAGGRLVLPAGLPGCLPLPGSG